MAADTYLPHGDPTKAHGQRTHGELSPARERFVNEYVKDFNGTRAYQAAYPNVKKTTTAAVLASKLLTQPAVAEALALRQEEERIESGITVQDIVAQERYIAFSDIRKLFSGGYCTTAPTDLPDNIAPAVASVEIREIGMDPETGQVMYLYRYKLWDKGKSLERLSRHLGMYNDQPVGALDLGAGLDIMSKLRGASEQELLVMARLFGMDGSQDESRYQSALGLEPSTGAAQ